MQFIVFVVFLMHITGKLTNDFYSRYMFCVNKIEKKRKTLLYRTFQYLGLYN